MCLRYGIPGFIEKVDHSLCHYSQREWPKTFNDGRDDNVDGSNSVAGANDWYKGALSWVKLLGESHTTFFLG